MFSRIQVSLDTSEFAEFALPAAIELARRSEATIDLVGVHEPITGLELAEWDSATVTWMEEDLARLADRVAEASGRPVETHIEHGPVVSSLLARVSESGAELLVTATHGRGILTRAWMGSVADGLIRHAHVPLLLVRPDEAGAPPPTDFNRILVPLDGSELSTRVLPLALAVARGFGASVRLVRVLPVSTQVASPYAPTLLQVAPELSQEARDAAEAWLVAQAKAIGDEGIAVTTAVRTAVTPSVAICDEAEEYGANLIVMATHGRAGLERAFLGSTADKIVRSTRVPVMISNPEIEG